MDLAEGGDPIIQCSGGLPGGRQALRRRAPGWPRCYMAGHMAERVSAGKLVGIMVGCVVVGVMVFMMIAILSGLFSGNGEP